MNSLSLTAPGSRPASRQIRQRLMDLHRAVTLQELWRSTRRLLLPLFPCHSLSLYLNYLDHGGRFRVLHHQNAPGTPLPWAERRRVSPGQAFLCRHVGTRIFTTRDLIADFARLEQTAYYREVMQAEGWHSHLCLAHWQKEEPVAIIVLRRTSQQGAFAPEDRDFLEAFYDHFDVALERIRRTQGAQMAHASLAALPSGLLVLDEQGRPMLKNHAAMEACLSWNHGDAHAYDSAKCFAVPEPIAGACRALLHEASETARVAHPAGKGSATIRRMPHRDGALGEPYFLVQFSDETPQRPPGAFLPLSPRERDVALAVAEGLSNAEVARKLGKSEITVKTQLSSIFSKLGIKRRTQLSALLLG